MNDFGTLFTPTENSPMLKTLNKSQCSSKVNIYHPIKQTNQTLQNLRFPAVSFSWNVYKMLMVIIQVSKYKFFITGPLVKLRMAKTKHPAAKTTTKTINPIISLLFLFLCFPKFSCFSLFVWSKSAETKQTTLKFQIDDRKLWWRTCLIVRILLRVNCIIVVNSGW